MTLEERPLNIGKKIPSILIQMNPAKLVISHYAAIGIKWTIEEQTGEIYDSVGDAVLERLCENDDKA